MKLFELVRRLWARKPAAIEQAPTRTTRTRPPACTNCGGSGFATDGRACTVCAATGVLPAAVARCGCVDCRIAYMAAACQRRN